MNQFVAKYVSDHEVVKGKDKSKMQFYLPNENYCVPAKFKGINNSPWFLMESSGAKKNLYRIYGVLSFNINGEKAQLNIYQSQSLIQTEKYKNHLFIPFTDATSGIETYSSGRYLDLDITDIKGEFVLLDFNKAYNPYCAYINGIYNCPVPPKENRLSIAIKAGEKVFKADH